MLRGALQRCGLYEYRETIGWRCWDLMERAWTRRGNAGDAHRLWNKFRYAGAVIPVVAAGAGGSLVGHVQGAVNDRITLRSRG